MEQNVEQNVEQNELKDIINTKDDGFGFYLKSIREQRNLSINDISNELHLDEKIIRALENEDYKQLPEPAFVFGYIRIYAKLLNVRSEPLIEYYKKDYGQEHFEPDLKVSETRRIRKSSQNFKIVMPVLMFLFFALLAVGGWKLWLYVSENYINVENSTGSEELLINQSETNGNSNEMLENIIDDSDNLSLPMLYETKDNASELDNRTSQTESQINEEAAASIDESISSVEDSLHEPNSQLTEILPENGSQTAEFSTNTEKIEDSLNVGDSINVEDSVNTDEEISSIASNENTALGTDNQLVLEFAADSWIKIKDAAGKTLSFGVKKSGTSLSLAGRRPYTMIVGNADSVKVSIDGKIFDHSSFTNENSVARFTIK